MKRILITGSRDWPEEQKDTIELALVLYLSNVEGGEEVTVVHGGARGADVMAGELAKGMNLQVEVHALTKKDWDRDGKKAGFIRNSKMVELGADICLAFIKDNSRGATMCADLAEKKGIATIRWHFDNGVLS